MALNTSSSSFRLPDAETTGAHLIPLVQIWVWGPQLFFHARQALFHWTAFLALGKTGEVSKWWKGRGETRNKTFYKDHNSKQLESILYFSKKEKSDQERLHSNKNKSDFLNFFFLLTCTMQAQKKRTNEETRENG